MSTPWFRPYARFSYRPVTAEGRAVIAAMVIFSVPLGIASLAYAESHQLVSWVLGCAAVVVALVGHAVVVWKMEREYRSR